MNANRPPHDVRRRLAEGDVVVIDGAVATELMGRGISLHHERWNLIANVDAAAAVRAMHADYLAAGCDVISTNTFGAGPNEMRAAGLGGRRFVAINQAGVRAAIDARAAAGASGVAVAAVMSCPSYAGSHLGTYGEWAAVLAEAGPDLIAVEMVGTTADGAEAIAAVHATGLPVWVGVSARRDRTGRLVTETVGAPAEDLRTMVAELAGMDVAAMTVMHTELADTEDALRILRDAYTGPIGAYPHQGTWDPPVWTAGPVAPADLAAAARRWVALGAQVVGGCCGTGPAHIAAVADAVRGPAADQ